ncbi:DUF2834 domain-containing protein [Flammeovirga sp. SubArs3]|uniref:DUF2834 domain-containing protein n=1 Tax=Flammeovirga sp. SubArs3 TaxID=2995316 RepID=UPI00248C54B1|nr:DUF2834 domain-containing protein [Flammeovirga sp. SubArs3]
MSTKNIYFTLFILGSIIPYYEFISFIIKNGLDLALLFDQLLATPISRFFAYDVIISAIVLLLFILKEKDDVKNYWLSIVVTFVIGVSAGLPLFLYQKEKNN